MPKSKEEGLHIDCAEVAGDYLIGHRTPDFIIIGAGDIETENRVALTPDTARELFNWLGAELHKW